MDLLEIILKIVEGRPRAEVEDSPVWVPDAETSKCMHCKTSQFSVINRRVRTKSL